MLLPHTRLCPQGRLASFQARTHPYMHYTHPYLAVFSVSVTPLSVRLATGGGVPAACCCCCWCWWCRYTAPPYSAAAFLVAVSAAALTCALSEVVDGGESEEDARVSVPIRR